MSSRMKFTEYSLRIGTATAWVEAGGDAAELQHLGAWATQIGKEVYACMSVERQLQLQQASLEADSTSLDALLRISEQAAQSRDAVFVHGAAPVRSEAAGLAAVMAPPVAKRPLLAAAQSTLKFARTTAGA